MKGCAIALLLATTVAEPPPTPEAAPRVGVESGVLEGASQVSGGPLLSFSGIPYAASPAGAGRWRPPHPPQAWRGVRQALRPGPVCPQPDREAANLRRLTTALGGDPAWVPPLGETSEDCLSLNVFTSGLSSAKGRAVMVWLHGGANRFGSGNDQAKALVPYGVVVVTLNYRLGLLGFLAHPALRKESPHASSGNYGLLDQLEALRWVRRNIAAFGGDPERVTVFGHSAGGDSIAQLLASPLSRGLFQRAVIQSGGLGTSRPRAEMEAEGVKIASDLGATGDDPLTALRGLPVERLLAARGGPFDAVADGWVVPAPGPGALSPARADTLPLLVGATDDEASAFSLPEDRESYLGALAETGPAWKDLVSAQYPAGDDAQIRPALARLVTDRDFACPARYVAAKRHGPTWLYRFSAPPTARPGAPGAFHGADVRLLFDLSYGVPLGPIAETVGDAMRRYWTRFAATGDPNVAGLPRWPPYEGPQPLSLELNDPIRARPDPGKGACDLFDRIWDAAR